jgi:hypothetical protein
MGLKVCSPILSGFSAHRISVLLSEPQIPANVSSPTFSRIFGTNTNAFELLVMKRKIMGPCWLQIKKPHVEYKGVCFFRSETRALAQTLRRSLGASLK